MQDPELVKCSILPAKQITIHNKKDIFEAHTRVANLPPDFSTNGLGYQHIIICHTPPSDAILQQNTAASEKHRNSQAYDIIIRM